MEQSQGSREAVLYFSDSQLLFLHPTKTGGSTVEHCLMQALKDSVAPHRLASLQYLNDDSHHEHHDIKKQLMFGNYQDAEIPRVSLQHACMGIARKVLGEAVFDRARKVAIVRNPYHRIVSLFFYYGFDRDSTLSAFVHDRLPLFARASSKLAINLAAKQTLYTHRDGAPAVDLVLRLERLEESLAQLSEFLEVPLRYDGTRLRKSSASLTFTDYLDAYDEQSLAIVQELYADDFELLGYGT